MWNLFRKPKSVSAILLELDDLFESSGESVWRNKIKPAQAMSGNQQAHHILEWYGGMGTFNDLILCNLNGHTVEDALYNSVNDKLEELRSTLFVACKRVVNK